MRGFATLVGLGSLALGLGGCSNDGGPLAVEARWVLSCPVGDICSPSAAHVVQGEEGDPGLVVTCSAVDVGNGLRAVSLEIVDGVTRGKLALRNIIFDEIGTVQPTSGCQVRVEEGVNVYDNAACGPTVPSDAQPCQIGNFVLDPGAPEGPSFSTTVLCRGLTNAAASRRDLTSPDYVAGGAPVDLHFANCEGF